MEINQITQNYRIKKNLSLRGFAEEINRSLINTGVTFTKVHRWETSNYEPPLDLLFECVATYRGTERHWIAEWAVDNIVAMYPDLVQSGVITFHLPVSIRE